MWRMSWYVRYMTMPIIAASPDMPSVCSSLVLSGFPPRIARMVLMTICQPSSGGMGSMLSRAMLKVMTPTIASQAWNLATLTASAV